MAPRRTPEERAALATPSASDILTAQLAWPDDARGTGLEAILDATAEPTEEDRP